MSAAGQGTTAPTTQAQGTESTAQSGMNLTQNSQWQSQLDDVMNKIMAGEKFNYDMNSDAMYQQYRDIYENQANMAMQNAMAQNAALTGGYGSSYGQMVGQQAYAQQMQGLNEIGLDLYDRAYNQYQNEQNNLYDQYAMLAEKEALDYNRDYQANRDTVADQQWQQSFDYQKAQDEIAQGQWQDTFDYQKEQDALAQENYQNQFDYQQSQDALAQKNYENEFAYQQNRDQVADSQWQQTMDYQQSQDQLAQSNWEKQFEYQQAQNELAQKNYENEFAYQQGRDEVADEQWLKQYEQWEKEYASSEAQREADNAYRDEAFQYQQSQDALAQENWQTSMDYQKEQDKLAQENWQAQFDESVKQNEADNAYRNEAFEYQKEMDKQNQTNYENEFAYQQSQDQQAQDNWLKQYEQWEKEYASSEEQRALDNQYRDSALEYQKEQDKQSQANWEAQFNESVNQNAADNKYREDVFNYQKEQDAQSQENWQAEFDREGQWYDDAQEAAKPTTKYEGEGALNGQEVPKQLAGTPGLTTTNTNFFDDNGNWKQAAVVSSNGENGTTTYTIGGKETTVKTGTNPYTNTENPDAKDGKTFGNGYQPNNIGGEKLEPAKGTKLSDGSEAPEYDVINGTKQTIYKTGDGQCWIWDDSANEYLPYGEPYDEKKPTNPTITNSSTGGKGAYGGSVHNLPPHLYN